MIEGMTKEEHARADMWDAMSIGAIVGFAAGMAVATWLVPVLAR